MAASAAEDAVVLEQAGYAGVLVENFYDAPFRPGRVDPETIASLAVVAAAVRSAVKIPVGINVLRNDGLSALGVAVATGASFIRVNVLAGAAVTDQGLVQGEADVLLRRRAALRSDVAILADVDVKHATTLDERPVAERAIDLVLREGADAVLVTGSSTGRPVDLDQLGLVAEAVAPAPVLAASGTTTSNVKDVLARCAGAVVGTALKNPNSGRVDPDRAAALIESSTA